MELEFSFPNFLLSLILPISKIFSKHLKLMISSLMTMLIQIIPILTHLGHFSCLHCQFDSARGKILSELTYQVSQFVSTILLMVLQYHVQQTNIIGWLQSQKNCLHAFFSALCPFAEYVEMVIVSRVKKPLGTSR